MPADTLTIRAQFDEAQGTAKALGVQFQAVEVKAPNPDFEGAFRFMAKERIGGLVTEGPPLIALHQKRILGLAEKYRLPAIHTEQEWANDGGLMSYGANRSDPYRRAAVFVDRILKGTRPADRLTGLGRKALAVTADVGVATQVSQLFDTVRTEFGRLDILVNNAGLWFRKPFL